MTLAAFIFTAVAAIFLFRLPRQLAPLPLLVGASYITLSPSIDIGPFHFTVIRILIAVGVVRVIMKRERLKGGGHGLDKLIILWAVWVVVSCFFHEDFGEIIVFRLGVAYNALGTYFLLRIFLQDEKDAVGLFKVVLLALIPIACEMVNEGMTGRNFFSCFGGVAELSEIRGGKIRAQGPFGHSILAGTVGALCLPIAIFFWKSNRKLALLGLGTTGAIVVASRCSGPILTSMFGCFGLCLWFVRSNLRLIRWTVFLGVMALALIMDAPLYYLLARIDLTGSSTGYHRAILIEATIKYFSDWWLFGTDYTLHWTPNAGFGNDTDITNHYIRMGVWGGVPLMIIFISILIVAFASVGEALRQKAQDSSDQQFFIWTLGCILFAHVTTMMSVSYFDQSVFFIYLVLAAIGSLRTKAAFGFATVAVPPVNHEEDLSHHS